MSWVTEASFIEDFVAMYNYKIQKKKNIMIWREVRTGYGRPDIALIEYHPEILLNRIYASKAIHSQLSNLAACAMCHLNARSWTDVIKLGAMLNCRENTLRTVIKELCSRQLIEAKENLIKARPKKEILAIKKITVFEAKLFQWKNAIDQAERNLWFTNDSYVLMPEKKEEMSRSIVEHCNKKGVGLGFFSLNEGVRYPLRPERTGITDTPLLWIFNEGLMERYDSRCELFTGFADITSSIPEYSH